MVTWKWLTPLIIAFAIATQAIASAQIYKWIDANGSNAPPQMDAQEIAARINKSTDAHAEATAASKSGANMNTGLQSADLLGSWYMSKTNERSDWTFKPGGIFEGVMADSMGRVIKTGTYKVVGNQIIINTTNKMDDAFGKRTVSSHEEFGVLNFEKNTLLIQIDERGFITKPEPYTFKRK